MAGRIPPTHMAWVDHDLPWLTMTYHSQQEHSTAGMTPGPTFQTNVTLTLGQGHSFSKLLNSLSSYIIAPISTLTQSITFCQPPRGRHVPCFKLIDSIILKKMDNCISGAGHSQIPKSLDICLSNLIYYLQLQVVSQWKLTKPNTCTI